MELKDIHLRENRAILCDRIFAICYDRHITQTQLASLLNESVSKISNWHSRKSIPANRVQQLLSILDLDLNYLLNDDNFKQDITSKGSKAYRDNANIIYGISPSDMTKLFDKVADLMYKNHIDQTSLAKELGISRQAINQWYKEKRVPLKNLARICDILDVNVGDLLELSNTQNATINGDNNQINQTNQNFLDNDTKEPIQNSINTGDKYETELLKIYRILPITHQLQLLQYAISLKDNLIIKG